jgi:hypothetical protein
MAESCSFLQGTGALDYVHYHEQDKVEVLVAKNGIVGEELRGSWPCLVGTDP